MLVLLIPEKIISIILFWYSSTGSSNVGAAIQSGYMAFPSVSSRSANILWYVSPVDCCLPHCKVKSHGVTITPAQLAVTMVTNWSVPGCLDWLWCCLKSACLTLPRFSSTWVSTYVPYMFIMIPFANRQENFGWLQRGMLADQGLCGFPLGYHCKSVWTKH